MRRIPRPSLDLRFVILAVVYALLVIAVGQRPASNLPRLDFGWGGIGADKYVHFAIYALLSGLIWRAQVPRDAAREPATRHPALWAIGLTAAVGCVDEVAQSLADRGRHGDALDILADTLGACFAVAWAMWFRRRNFQRPS